MLAFWVTSIFQKNPSWKKNVVPETEKPRWLSRAPCTWSTMWRVREPCEISEQVWFSQTAILLTVYNERFVTCLMFSPFARLHATVTDCKKRIEHHHYWSNNAIFFCLFLMYKFCFARFLFVHLHSWFQMVATTWRTMVPTKTWRHWATRPSSNASLCLDNSISWCFMGSSTIGFPWQVGFRCLNTFSLGIWITRDISFGQNVW